MSLVPFVRCRHHGLVLGSYFHTTVPSLVPNRSGSRSVTMPSMPSRTRLVKDLKPRSSTSGKKKFGGRLEVAPRNRDKRRPIQAGERSGSRYSDHRTDSKSRGLYPPGSDKPRPTSWANRDPKTEPSVSPSSPANRLASPPPRKPKIVNPLGDEFVLTTKTEPADRLPGEFTSPPLMPGLLASVHDVLGTDTRPTPIQALSLKHLFRPPPQQETGTSPWKEYLLASETGSGKSIAYLLPVLQHLKESELASTTQPPQGASSIPPRALNPRALVLAPTHELARQLSAFAKALLHNIKLRVLCVSRANVPSTARGVGTASKMATQMEMARTTGEGEFELHPGGKRRPVDLIVGTPMKMLELTRGRGWDWRLEEERQREEQKGSNVEDRWDLDEKGHKIRREPERRWKEAEPDMSLAGIEWVVVDEADVLFDPDFQESTRMLLADIAAARGHPVPFSPSTRQIPSNSSNSSSLSIPPSAPVSYPFHLLLTSATIPASLAAYLDAHHPRLTRLASPHLHRLPRTLQTEHAHWTGGRRDADIVRRIRRVWAEESHARNRSRVLIFCNKSARAEGLAAHLKEAGIANVVLTSASGARRRGSNHHLDGFLRAPRRETEKERMMPSVRAAQKAGEMEQAEADEKEDMSQSEDQPKVLITTSLLSRGLDFAPTIKHVFIVDEPRNMVDFLHRAGRAGRAGQQGTVVVFGKAKGRGSERTKLVRKKVGALAA